MTVTHMQQLGMLDSSQKLNSVLFTLQAKLVNAGSVSFGCEGVSSDSSFCLCGG